MTLQEWFDELVGMEEDMATDDPELCDAHEAYVNAHDELVHILNKRGFDITPPTH